MRRRIFFSLGILIVAVFCFSCAHFLANRNITFAQRLIVPSSILTYDKTQIELEKSFSVLENKSTFNFSNANKFRNFYNSNGYIRGTINGNLLEFKDDADIPSEFRTSVYSASDVPVFIDFDLLTLQHSDFFKGEKYVIDNSVVYRIPSEELLRLFAIAKEKEASFSRAQDYEWLKKQIPYATLIILFLLWCIPFWNWLKQKLKFKSFELHISFKCKK